jgi:hypothetical protein
MTSGSGVGRSPQSARSIAPTHRRRKPRARRAPARRELDNRAGCRGAEGRYRILGRQRDSHRDTGADAKARAGSEPAVPARFNATAAVIGLKHCRVIYSHRHRQLRRIGSADGAVGGGSVEK